MVVQGDALIVDLDLFALLQIVVDNHFAAGANQRAPQLYRGQPVGVDMRDRAAFTNHVRWAMFSVPSGYVTETGRGDSAWPDRQRVVHNRQIMHCEIPQHVDVVLKESKIYAD